MGASPNDSKVPVNILFSLVLQFAPLWLRKFE